LVHAPTVAGRTNPAADKPANAPKRLLLIFIINNIKVIN
jgi:hypothetical protein